jgi:nucleoid-associated protein YgaU
MGLFDFVLNAGKKLFGPGDAEAAKSADPEVLTKRSAALENEIKSLGLEVEGLKVKMAGDTAHVRGKVKTQADREKVVLALGNVEGVARVDDGGLEVTSPGGAARMYTVQKGDTLSKIAKEHYGDANKYQAIFEANRPMLAHPDKIYPGQVLRVPPLD